MSVKTMLLLLGVGSVFAILGLAAARRQSIRPVAGVSSAHDPQAAKAGAPPRVALDGTSDTEGAALAGGGAAEPASESWAAASYSRAGGPSRPSHRLEAFDSLDTEDLTSEWLARATEAPAAGDFGAFAADDPAEIAADSVSMISDASRHAAVSALDEDAEDDPREGDDDGLRRRS